MDVDFNQALDGPNWKMVANLPYNVGTPVVLEALQKAPDIEQFVVMVQIEVARRLAASAGSHDYGLPSVVVGIHAKASLAFTVPPQVFYPPPRVGSAVVVINRREAPEHASRAVLLARAAFGHRRKMVRGSLAEVLSDPEASLEKAGIAPTSRAEDLSPEDYLKLAAVS
jgi:16S rRNA (adenine1518-N6/adenine1519-N6)-dimethyltransferase